MITIAGREDKRASDLLFACVRRYDLKIVGYEINLPLVTSKSVSPGI